MVKKKLPRKSQVVSQNQTQQGVTGSRPIKLDGHTYREKFSLLDRSFFDRRNIRASHTDRENLGEAIAAWYALAYLGEQHAARVETYYDATRKRVEVVSKYLKDTKHTIDEYYTDPNALNHSLGKRKHVLLVLTNEPTTPPPEGEWHVHPNSNLAKTLARTLAVSAIIGDHDVNTGNRMVLQKEGQEIEIGSIDFGHAFNDLIHAPYAVGGRIRLTEHPVFDFLNRSQVGDLRLGGSISKLWRDYKGFVPSEVLGNALIEIGSNQEAQQIGLENAKKEFSALFELIKENPTDTESKAYILKSFNEIHHAMTGKFFPAGQTEAENLDTFFTAIDLFIQKNAADAVHAGHMMILQTQFTKALHQDIDDLDTFSETWKKKFQSLQLMDTDGKLLYPWFKSSITLPPFQGTFEAYLIHERNQYLQTKHDQEMAKTNPNPTILDYILLQMRQLLDYITAYFKNTLQPLAPPKPEIEKDIATPQKQVKLEKRIDDSQTPNFK